METASDQLTRERGQFNDIGGRYIHTLFEGVDTLEERVLNYIHDNSEYKRLVEQFIAKYPVKHSFINEWFYQHIEQISPEIRFYWEQAICNHLVRNESTGLNYELEAICKKSSWAVNILLQKECGKMKEFQYEIGGFTFGDYFVELIYDLLVYFLPIYLELKRQVCKNLLANHISNIRATFCGKNSEFAGLFGINTNFIEPELNQILNKARKELEENNRF